MKAIFDVKNINYKNNTRATGVIATDYERLISDYSLYDQFDLIFLVDEVPKNKIPVIARLKKVVLGFSYKTLTDEPDFYNNLDSKFFCYEEATTFTMVNLLINIGVDFLLIGEDLCFNIQDISNYCHNNNVSLMCYANFAKPLGNQEGFFIRPEDMYAYENYLDFVILKGEYLSKQLETLYDVYFVDKHWEGNLQEIIYGLTKPIDNRSILKPFGICRLKCRRRCLLEQCNLCEVSYSLSSTCIDKGFSIK